LGGLGKESHKRLWGGDAGGGAGRGGAECSRSVARLATHGVVHRCAFKAKGLQ
jgi:hypothetical protein